MPMPQLSWKIDLNAILTILVILGGLAVVWGQIGTKLDDHAKSIAEIHQDMKDVSSKLTAVQIEQERVRTKLEDAEQRGRH